MIEIALPEPVVARTGYAIWNEYAIELETGLLLRSLVASAKPSLVVEAGTGEGIATSFLAAGVSANGKGRVVTFECNEPWLTAAREKFQGVAEIEVREGFSRFADDLEPDFVFVDCVSDQRAEEISYWLTHPGRPLTVIHDARRDYYPYHLGEGVFVLGHDGVWIGRGKEN